MQAETIIIGGGIIGLSVAWRLAEAGGDVVVVDGRSAAPRSSLAAAGMLAPSFEYDAADRQGLHDKQSKTEGGADASLHQAMTELGLDGLSRWPAFAAALEDAAGASIDFQRQGILGVALCEDDLTGFQQRADAMAAAGAPCEMISSDAARRIEPGLSEQVLGAFFAPGEGQVDPVRTVDALAAAFLRAGGRVCTRVAEWVEVTADGVAVKLTSERAPLTGRRVIIASGARHIDIRDGEGLAVAPPPLRPVKGEAMALAPLKTESPTHVIRAPGVYICPKADGRVVLGATEVEGRNDLIPEDASIAGLAERAGDILPALATASETHRWAGLRPGTPDGAPIIGPALNGGEGGDDRVIYALGAYRNGVLFAPAIADIVASRLLGRQTPWPAAFAPQRFAPSPPAAHAMAVG